MVFIVSLNNRFFYFIQMYGTLEQEVLLYFKSHFFLETLTFSQVVRR